VGNDAFTTAPCVVFDLDGTLVDSAPGIVDCLAAALRASGHPVHHASSLTRFVGPPVADTIRALTGLSDAGVAVAVRTYREFYAARGIQNSVVFPGIFGALGALRELGVRMAVATSKRESHATRMLEIHGMTSFFTIVCGADEEDAHSGKSEVIAACLGRLHAAGVDTARTLYVGDRKYDVAGGIATGLPVVFAGWGYGSTEESIGAVATTVTPDQLIQTLSSLFEQTGRNPSL
jgi:phosphoglycolate phosphatase